jgi:hypothetical protein
VRPAPNLRLIGSAATSTTQTAIVSSVSCGAAKSIYSIGSTPTGNTRTNWPFRLNPSQRAILEIEEFMNTEETPKLDDKVASALLMLMYELEMITVIEKVSPAIEELRGKVKPAAVILGLFQIATEFIESNKGHDVADQFAKTCAEALMTAVKSGLPEPQ